VRPQSDGTPPSKRPEYWADSPTLRNEDPFASPSYTAISGIVDHMYAAVRGKGSLWDWGNQAGGALDMYKPGIASALSGSYERDAVLYRSPDGQFYVLNADQSNYWSKYAE
jgi:hypothetical protein